MHGECCNFPTTELHFGKFLVNFAKNFNLVQRGNFIKQIHEFFKINSLRSNLSPLRKIILKNDKNVPKIQSIQFPNSSENKMLQEKECKIKNNETP